MNTRTWRLGVAAVVATAASSLVLVGPASPASAGTACDANAIVINSGSGGELESNALGHYHGYDAHYVVSRSSDNVWEWWADNNGGWDGDTADTFFGYRQC
jgi:hypothetical protein